VIVVSRGTARAGEDDAASEAIAVVPSIQPTQSELLASIPSDKPSTVQPTVSTRADEVAK